MRISDWSSDVCSSDLILAAAGGIGAALRVDLLFAKRRDRLLRNQCGRIALNRLTAGQIGEIGKGLTGIGHLRTHHVLAVHGRAIEDFTLLRGVRMVRAGEDTPIAHLLAAERAAGDNRKGYV